MKRVNFTIQTLALSLCMGIIISCNPTVSTTHAIPTPPTPKPTTVLTPLAEFQLGHCDKPEEEYLFPKISSNMACSPACNCPEIEPPQPAIKRDGEDIRYNFDQVIGSFEPWESRWSRYWIADPRLVWRYALRDRWDTIRSGRFENSTSKLHGYGDSSHWDQRRGLYPWSWSKLDKPVCPRWGWGMLSKAYALFVQWGIDREVAF